MTIPASSVPVTTGRRNLATSLWYAFLQSLGDKQDALVSGTNIKTINGASVLGSGDLTVGGGSIAQAMIIGSMRI